jgi:hypothetical protein
LPPFLATPLALLSLSPAPVLMVVVPHDGYRPMCLEVPRVPEKVD